MAPKKKTQSYAGLLANGPQWGGAGRSFPKPGTPSLEAGPMDPSTAFNAFLHGQIPLEQYRQAEQASREAGWQGWWEKPRINKFVDVAGNVIDAMTGGGKMAVGGIVRGPGKKAIEAGLKRGLKTFRAGPMRKTMQRTLHGTQSLEARAKPTTHPKGAVGAYWPEGKAWVEKGGGRFGEVPTALHEGGMHHSYASTAGLREKWVKAASGSNLHPFVKQNYPSNLNKHAQASETFAHLGEEMGTPGATISATPQQLRAMEELTGDDSLIFRFWHRVKNPKTGKFYDSPEQLLKEL